MKMYECLEPCAGCQKSGRQAPRWSKGELCQTCQKDLNLGRELKKDFDPSQYVYVTSTWYKLEFYPNSHGRDIERGFYRLMDFLERKVESKGSIVLAQGDGCTSSKRVTTEGLTN